MPLRKLSLTSSTPFRKRGTQVRIARLALLPMLVLQLIACERSAKPESIVSMFFEAINDKDVNAMLRCVDPRQERMFRASFRVIEKLTGFPIENVLDMLPGLAQLIAPGQLDDFRFTNVRVLESRVTDREAHVTVTANYEQTVGGSRRSSPEMLAFYLRRFDKEGWRILGVQSRVR
jgi:hypothetical protein